MAKKEVVETVTKSKPNKVNSQGIPRQKTMSRTEMDKLMLDNFVTLQKVLTNLTIKFNDLADQMSKMLNLFEISAKSFLEKEGKGMGLSKEDKEFLSKLDKVFDQNRKIARALTMMEERIRGNNPAPNQPPQGNMQRF